MISDHMPFGYWLPGTHVFVYLEHLPTEGFQKLQINRFDADQKKKTTIMTDLPFGVELIGTSPDGKWIYLQSHADLSKQESP